MALQKYGENHMKKERQARFRAGSGSAAEVSTSYDAV